ncbi:hypothetical protein BD626DRAFT_241543 [Schizophyllum amplum]|uniref:Stress-response A/B barrel domain-containing protein n=1 Tax=Schizophyllum amplum TaxID=97359 RepID=A0A550BW21_9AGAR|nr:hypothetical protein BD626DRAFT_241543 [Auriculariopsis ampla]
MTVHHFVFAKFRPHLNPRERLAAFARVDALLGAVFVKGMPGVRGLRSWHTGPPGEVEAAWVERAWQMDAAGMHTGAMQGTEGRDFGFTAEFEDWQAFRDSLPHEWHHEIYRFVKGVTVGDFFIYQVDTERRGQACGTVATPSDRLNATHACEQDEVATLGARDEELVGDSRHDNTYRDGSRRDGPRRDGSRRDADRGSRRDGSRRDADRGSRRDGSRRDESRLGNTRDTSRRGNTQRDTSRRDDHVEETRNWHFAMVGGAQRRQARL